MAGISEIVTRLWSMLQVGTGAILSIMVFGVIQSVLGHFNSVMAQDIPKPEEFFPLEVGNVWFYSVERIVWTDPLEQRDTTHLFAEQTIVTDTTIADTTWQVVRLRHFSKNGELLDEGKAHLRMVIMGEYAYTEATFPFEDRIHIPVSGTVFSFYSLPLNRCVESMDGLSIRDKESGACTWLMADMNWFDGLGRQSQCSETYLDAGIGMKSYWCNYTFNSPYVDEKAILVYAQLKNRTWGKKPLTTDSPQPSPASFSLDVYPNPFSNFLNLEVRSGETARAQIQVFDVLGRVVHQEAAPIQQGVLLRAC